MAAPAAEGRLQQDQHDQCMQPFADAAACQSDLEAPKMCQSADRSHCWAMRTKLVCLALLMLGTLVLFMIKEPRKSAQVDAPEHPAYPTRWRTSNSLGFHSVDQLAEEQDPKVHKVFLQSKIAWAMFQVALSIVVFNCSKLSFRTWMNTANDDFLKCLAHNCFAEGVGFVIFWGFNVTVGQTPVCETVFLIWMLSVTTPGIILQLWYLRMMDRQKDDNFFQNSWANIMTVGAVLGLIALLLHGTVPQKAFGAACFELPIILRAIYALVLWRQSRFVEDRVKPEKKRVLWWSGLYFLNLILNYINHVYDVSTLAKPELLSIKGIVASRFLAMVLFCTQAYLSYKLTEAGAFLHHKKDNSAWKEWQPPREVEETNQTHSFGISPERLWTWSYVAYALAYLFSFILFKTVTKPDLNKSPIFHMYKTYHPCMLLDYPPGTLFAQPFFVLQVFLQDAAVILSFVRNVKFGNLKLIVTSAFGMTIWLLCSTCFVLVFTFNPGVTSVMDHSIPYMAYVFGIATFMFTESFTVAERFGMGNKRYKRGSVLIGNLGFFYGYVALVVGMICYGETFMLGTFIKNASNVWKPTTDIAADGKVTLDPVPGTAAVIVDCLYMLWAWRSPLTKFPMRFEVSSFSNLSPSAHVMSLQPSPGTLSTTVRAKSLGLIAMIFAMVGVTLAVSLNYQVHPDASILWRENFQRLPGSALTAVFWVVTCLFLTSWVLIVIFHETYTNKNWHVKRAVQGAGCLLILSSLFAFGSTIPDAAAWGHFGAQIFQVCLTVWLCAMLGVLAQHRNALDMHLVIPEAIGCVAAIASIFVSFMLESPISDLAWIVAVFVYLMNDSLGRTLAVSDIHVQYEVSAGSGQRPAGSSSSIWCCCVATKISGAWSEFWHKYRPCWLYADPDQRYVDFTSKDWLQEDDAAEALAAAQTAAALAAAQTEMISTGNQ